MKRFNNKHIIILFIVILDQLTKLFIRENFSLYQSKPVTSFLSLTYIHNTGMAWGFFQNKAYSNIVFIFIMIAILACFAIYQKKLIEFAQKKAFRSKEEVADSRLEKFKQLSDNGKIKVLENV